MDAGIYTHSIRRMIYSGFRRWLPTDNIFRNDATFGPGEQRKPPALRRCAATQRYGADVSTFLESTGVTGVSPLLRLHDLYGYDIHNDNPNDIVHILKVVLGKLFKVIKGKRLPKPIQPSKKRTLDNIQKEDRARIDLGLTIEAHKQWFINEKIQKQIDKAWTELPGPPGFIRRLAKPFKYTGA